MNERSLGYAHKLARMIQVDTVSVKDVYDKDKFEKFHDVLKELFPLVWKNSEVHEFNGALLFKWKCASPKGEPILFMSHQDVVEATGKWEHEPFSGDIADGNIWGRGTVDTKGSLFCIFQSIEELMEEGYEPDVDVYIASSCNEETSGQGAPDTVAYLKEQGVHLQFLMDEGGMIKEEPIKGAKGKFAMIGCMEKGWGNYRFVAHSNGGHASAPSKGSALCRLAGFVNEIEKKNPFTARMNPTTIEMFRRLGPTISGPLGFVLRHAKGLSPLLGKLLPKVNHLAGAMISTTLAFTMAKGSDGLNVLPQEAWVTGNIRFINHQGPEETYELLSRIAAKYNVEVEVIDQNAAYPVVDYNAAPFKLVEKTIKDMFPGVIPTPYCMTGGTDARHYSPITENAIRFAPLEITEQQYGSIHGLNENIGVDTLAPGVDFYKQIVKSV